jgi:hypothetical protein
VVNDSVVISWGGLSDKDLNPPAAVELRRNPVYVPPSNRNSELFDQYETGPKLTVIDSYTEVDPRPSESYGFGGYVVPDAAPAGESYGFVSQSILAMKETSLSSTAIAPPTRTASRSSGQYMEPAFVPMMLAKPKEKKRWTPPTPLAQDQPQASPMKKVEGCWFLVDFFSCVYHSCGVFFTATVAQLERSHFKDEGVLRRTRAQRRYLKKCLPPPP